MNDLYLSLLMCNVLLLFMLKIEHYKYTIVEIEKIYILAQKMGE